MGFTSEAGESIAKGVPGYLPSGSDSNIGTLVDALGMEVDDLRALLDAVDAANTVQTATTVDELREHGKLVQEFPRGGESVEAYRRRLLANFQLVSSSGTIRDIMTALTTVMDADYEHIDYDTTDENGYAEFVVKYVYAQTLVIEPSDLNRMFERAAPAGARLALRIEEEGTFKPSNETEYNAGSGDPAWGPDGLDVNDDPLGQGGYPSGVLN